MGPSQNGELLDVMLSRQRKQKPYESGKVKAQSKKPMITEQKLQYRAIIQINGKVLRQTLAKKEVICNPQKVPGHKMKQLPTGYTVRCETNSHDFSETFHLNSQHCQQHDDGTEIY